MCVKRITLTVEVPDDTRPEQFWEDLVEKVYQTVSSVDPDIEAVAVLEDVKGDGDGEA